MVIMRNYCKNTSIFLDKKLERSARKYLRKLVALLVAL
jgi:hypothetical protein